MAPSMPHAGRREERKAQNRAKLLAAARKVFAEKELSAATVRDIVRETDLASGTFYNYFEDKNDAFRALLEELTDKARASVRTQRKLPDRNLEQRVSGAYRTYFELMLEERELFQVLRRNAGLVGLVSEEDIFEAVIRALFEDMVEWWDAEDLPKLDLDYLAAALVGAGFQIGTRLIERERPDAEAAARFCTRLFLGGVGAVGE